jgi:uncharacterized protein with PIN domain
MLGKLARFLRLLGYDVQYSTEYSDETLLKKAFEDDRILITSDENLFKEAVNRNIESMFIKGGSTIDRISQVIKRYNLDLTADPSISRCPQCGSIIKFELKENLKDRIPSRSYEEYDNFWLCTNNRCNKIYWQGSHWDNIKKMMRKIAEKIEL